MLDDPRHVGISKRERKWACRDTAAFFRDTNLGKRVVHGKVSTSSIWTSAGGSCQKFLNGDLRVLGCGWHDDESDGDIVSRLIADGQQKLETVVGAAIDTKSEKMSTVFLFVVCRQCLSRASVTRLDLGIEINYSRVSVRDTNARSTSPTTCSERKEQRSILH
jgi:hypothetical protein